MKSYIVSDKIIINASVESVWEVLTNPDFIKQWDDVPETYKGGKLTLGTVLNWEGHAKMTVTVLKAKEQLTLDLHLPKVELSSDKYNVNYTYRLAERNGQTELEFEIGDFGPLPNPNDYFDSTLEFVANGKQKIKELAEGLEHKPANIA